MSIIRAHCPLPLFQKQIGLFLGQSKNMCAGAGACARIHTRAHTRTRAHTYTRTHTHTHPRKRIMTQILTSGPKVEKY